MIIRILGEGQYVIAPEHLARLDELDAALQRAADTGDEAAFGSALSALLAAVRGLGTPLPDRTITPSDLALPDRSTGLGQVRDMLSDEGLIPR